MSQAVLEQELWTEVREIGLSGGLYLRPIQEISGVHQNKPWQKSKINLPQQFFRFVRMPFRIFRGKMYGNCFEVIVNFKLLCRLELGIINVLQLVRCHPGGGYPDIKSKASIESIKVQEG